jgi:ubiquinol-cytochrome c reductase iron-sulfur subunit
MFPSARAKAAGAPVEVDISKVEPGMMIRAEWRSKPVWIVHRTSDMLEGLKKVDSRVADPDSERPMQPAYAKKRVPFQKARVACPRRDLHPSRVLAVRQAESRARQWFGRGVAGGFFCPCHGSKFDLAVAFSRMCQHRLILKCRSTSSLRIRAW